MTRIEVEEVRMIFKQFYLQCLAHASYLIGSEGEAAVVDPQRDVDQYVNEAAAHGLEIKYVIESHLHADFVSGHRELADRTGAQIVFGVKAHATFSYLGVKDGDELRVGDFILRILETPGHTPEGISILSVDVDDREEVQRLFTGEHVVHRRRRPSRSRRFQRLFCGADGGDALRDRARQILTLPDEVEVYPAHGAGFCRWTQSTFSSTPIWEIPLLPRTQMHRWPSTASRCCVR